MKGTVKWFDVEKHFGFIKTDDGDYFAHESQVPEGVTLQENDVVTFDAVETDRGRQAQNIKLATGDEAEEVSEEPAEEAQTNEEA